MQLCNSACSSATLAAAARATQVAAAELFASGIGTESVAVRPAAATVAGAAGSPLVVAGNFAASAAAAELDVLAVAAAQTGAAVFAVLSATKRGCQLVVHCTANLAVD